MICQTIKVNIIEWVQWMSVLLSLLPMLPWKNALKSQKNLENVREKRLVFRYTFMSPSIPTLSSYGIAPQGHSMTNQMDRVLEAVKENEDRAIACGFNTQRIKLVSFVISAVYGGLAGSLWCLHLRFVGVENFDFMLNGQVIFVAIVGGVGTYFGPIVGSVAYLLLHDYVQLIIERWELVVGIILIFFILFFNQGIVGYIENRVAAYREKKAAGVGSIRGEESK